MASAPWLALLETKTGRRTIVMEERSVFVLPVALCLTSAEAIPGRLRFRGIANQG